VVSRALLLCLVRLAMEYLSKAETACRTSVAVVGVEYRSRLVQVGWFGYKF
jgi:hypothetical protein